MEINITILIQIGLFLFLFGWLSQFLFAPFMRLFDERERRIEGAKHEAVELQEAAQQKLQMAEEKVRSAQSEARQVLAELKAEGLSHQRNILDSARAGAQEKLTEARAILAHESQGAQAKLSGEVKQISELLLAKVLGEHEMTPGSSTQRVVKMECSSA